MPRTRPPFPAESGLWGMPTIIDNVETLATLPVIVNCGAGQYATLGTETSRGTKTFSLVGKVRRTGLIEVPFGTTLRCVIEDIGGGVAKGFKAVQTGGPSGGCLQRGVPRHPAGLREPGGRRLDPRLRRPHRPRPGHVHRRHRPLLPRVHAGRVVRQVRALSHRHRPPRRDPRRHLPGQGRARRPRPAGEARPRGEAQLPLRARPDSAQPGAHRRSNTSGASSSSTSSTAAAAPPSAATSSSTGSFPASAPAASAACRSALPEPSPDRAPRRTTSIRRSASSAAPAMRSAGSTRSPATPSSSPREPTMPPDVRLRIDSHGRRGPGGHDGAARGGKPPASRSPRCVPTPS